MKLVVQAWKCPHTKKIFESFDDYQKHRRDVIPQVRRYKRVKRASIACRKNLEQFRYTVTTLEGVIDWIIDNSKTIFDSAWYGNGNLDSVFRYNDNYGISYLFFEKVRYNPAIVDSYIPNNEFRPEPGNSYPGIECTVKLSKFGMSPSGHNQLSDFQVPYIVRKNILEIGGNYKSGIIYKVKMIFYAADWPLLVEPFKSEYALKILTSD